MSALWIVVVIACAAFAFTMLVREHRRQAREWKMREIASNILFENWRIADEAYFACMRKLLEAKRTGLSTYALEVQAQRLWQAALNAERSARRAS